VKNKSKLSNQILLNSSMKRELDQYKSLYIALYEMKDKPEILSMIMDKSKIVKNYFLLLHTKMNESLSLEIKEIVMISSISLILC
jgi:hypothetical protein